jgi:hypothetical protein
MRLKTEDLVFFGWGVIDEEVVAKIEYLRKRRYPYDGLSALVASGFDTEQQAQDFIRKLEAESQEGLVANATRRRKHQTT